MATQTDKTPPTSNLGQGREPIDENKHAPLFEFENETAPNYRLNLSRVFGKEFLAEATLKDKNLQTIIRQVKSHNWEQLKLVSRYYYNLRNDLAVAQSGCLFYDGKLVIPHQLQNLVINAVHRTHPGQLIKFIPNLANLLNPIRPLLKKENITNNKIPCEEIHTTALDKIKAEISKITEKNTSINKVKHVLNVMQATRDLERY